MVLDYFINSFNTGCRFFLLFIYLLSLTVLRGQICKKFSLNCPHFLEKVDSSQKAWFYLIQTLKSLVFITFPEFFIFFFICNRDFDCLFPWQPVGDPGRRPSCGMRGWHVMRAGVPPGILVRMPVNQAVRMNFKTTTLLEKTFCKIYF